MPPVLLVALGGVVGALARYALGLALPHDPGTWAWSTIIANAIGAAALCALLVRVRDRRVRLLVGTGVLGAFTTFSGFAVDAVLLAEAGRPATAAAYVAVSLVTLIGAGLAGRRIAR